MAPELGQMQVGCRGDRLVGGDVSGQAAAWVGRVICRTHRKRVAQRATPGWVGEGFLCLQAERVPRNHPAHPIYDAGFEQWRRGNYGQKRLAASRRDRGKDVAHFVGLTGCDRLHNCGKLSLVCA